MKNLELYLNSLTRNARASIDLILNNNRFFGKDFIDGEITPTELDYIPKPKNSIVEAQDLNTFMADVQFSHNKMWDTMIVVDSAVRSLVDRTNVAIKVLNKSNNKLGFGYDRLKSKVIGEEYRNIYTESFSDYSGTDKDQTSALIFSGKLSMGMSEISSEIENWLLTYPNVPNIEGISKDITGSYKTLSKINNEYNFINGDGLIVKASKDFYPVLSLSGISFNSAYKTKIERIEIIDSDYKSHIVATDYTAVPGDNKLIFDKNYNCRTINIYIRQYIYIVKTTETEIDRSDRDSVVLNFVEWVRNNFERYWVIIKNIDARYKTQTETYVYDFSISNIRMLDTKLLQKSIWVSEPISINGNINEITLDADISNGTQGNVRWYISVDSSLYVPITENSYIENEMLEFDNTGKAKTVYPIDIAAPIRLSNSELEYTIEIDENGNTFIYLITPTNELIGATYSTKYTGNVKLDELGLNTNSTKIKEMITNGERGEKFARSKNKQVILSNKPTDEIEVYASSIKCTPLPSGMTFADIAQTAAESPYIIYYRITDKVITFSKDVEAVRVFYFYKQSIIRVKAVLTSLNPYTGNSAEVNQLNISIGGSI